MLSSIRKIIRKKPEMGFDSIAGYLTKDDFKKLMESGTKPPSPNRKRTYKKWICEKCSHECFYSVVKCQICSSTHIREETLPTRYMLNVGAV